MYEPKDLFLPSLDRVALESMPYAPIPLTLFSAIDQMTPCFRARNPCPGARTRLWKQTHDDRLLPSVLYLMDSKSAVFLSFNGLSKLHCDGPSPLTKPI